ncbi:UDP-2,3-diacylglucosamine diphosphatase [Marinimicrobium koreense]|jgi:UDP-2,3-diacylglucosamine hydrolase|uniref:UDP-2,3-diacylglucosamine hydrolase n=1 Tax=Marinimicrobium koreense TaxID=306545 RepID=A0A3N1NUY7_9GAMM|nr:UDP-2,3-diacylglucosamine diphosphatase [Marinimicrobium koreense]ROQ20015.1 UDP-2,3-diacylglucosamine hydrolase [Marinimicrobium koreense]
MTRLFISDLHLNERQPTVTEGFFRFLRDRAQGVEALYILGDFFDAWIGDDDRSELSTAVAQALSALAESGTRIYLMHGNRDFLIGNEFARACGAELLPDPSVINLYGRPALLMHGDSLCTRDAEYMAFRRRVRSPQWQAEVLSLPLDKRRELAAHMRSQSQSMNSNKAQDIMDVTPREVEKAMRKERTDLLIHGHTHRPARHPLDLNGQPGERIVLGDWHERGWCLVAQPGVLQLESWEL